MQKKVLAMAVAGVLAAPGAVLAQSTVQIYGQAQFEHGYLDQGAGRPSTDYVESTGSYLGFKGTESLGGGMSAWFQCETTMDIRAFDQVGLCSRNSGLGFKGGFGNVWVGRWHTPMSRTIGLGSVGIEETGNLGLSGVLGGTGSTSIQRSSVGYDDTDGNNGASENRTRFRRRETCLTTYETPNMGGFMIGAAVSCGNKAAEASATSENNDKPRIWSFAGTYNKGPLALGIAYEKHLQLGTFSPGAAEFDDRGWGVSARYRMGNVTLGGYYLDRKFETATGDVKVKGAHLGVAWTIAGPHSLEAAYAWAGDGKGSAANGTTIAGTNQIIKGPDTGTSGFTIGYKYAFSKRTSAKIGYTRIENDSSTNSNQLFTAARPVAAGTDQDAFALVVKHRF